MNDPVWKAFDKLDGSGNPTGIIYTGSQVQLRYPYSLLFFGQVIRLLVPSATYGNSIYLRDSSLIQNEQSHKTQQGVASRLLARTRIRQCLTSRQPAIPSTKGSGRRRAHPAGTGAPFLVTQRAALAACPH
jgi:hypothetical protein